LVFFHPREVRCPTHGRVQEEIPRADRFTQVTCRFERLLPVLRQLMTQKAAPRVLLLEASTLSDLLHRAISRLGSGSRIENLQRIGIDEISCCKGLAQESVPSDGCLHAISGRGVFPRPDLGQIRLRRLSKTAGA